MAMNILTVVGARPQFIKSHPVSVALRAGCHGEYLVHTGQHYDFGMSEIFFKELGMRAADDNLGVGSGPPGWQTAEMIAKIEALISRRRPDWVLVYGDTNSTLAGALAARKAGVRLAHVEAGLRSFRRDMPEETNRVLTDHCADLLFCPTETAVENLRREGIVAGVRLVGDPMHATLVEWLPVAESRSGILDDLGLRQTRYVLATAHRAANADDPARLRAILEGLSAVDADVIFPVHPRTRGRIAEFGLEAVVSASPRLRLVDPVGYLDMLVLERHAAVIVTDSGGVQREAAWLGVPSVTLREETEWVETVRSGASVLVGCDRDAIGSAVARRFSEPRLAPIEPDGNAAASIVRLLEEGANGRGIATR